jgi:hypothetical protein
MEVDATQTQRRCPMNFLTDWQLTGFQFVVAIWCWLFLVGAHAVWRVVGGREADPVRPSGPVE